MYIHNSYHSIRSMLFCGLTSLHYNQNMESLRGQCPKHMALLRLKQHQCWPFIVQGTLTI